MNILSKIGNQDNVVIYEHICDTPADMSKIDRRYITLGSICIVLTGASGTMEVYMADSNKEWHDLLASSGSSALSGLSIHLCTNEEVSNGLPNIQNPLETMLYLVPAREDSGNLYDEFIYVNNAWERFGGASVDLSSYLTSAAASEIYAPKASPAFTGSISLGRKAGSTIGADSIAEGTNVIASGAQSHAEGGSTIASGMGSHAEGGGTIASNIQAHAEGNNTVAAGQSSHVEGNGIISSKKTINNKTYTGTGAHGNYSHAEGDATWAIGNGSHAEGGNTTASSNYSHAEGISTTASGEGSHAEGGSTTASGSSAHAEGGGTTASGYFSHAEGGGTTASGLNSHAEGENTSATGANSHTEGGGTSASAQFAHAEGNGTTASGTQAHAEGLMTTANHKSQHVFGEYNISDNSANAATTRGNYVEIVGNGTANNARSNARTLDWNGNEVLAGKLTVGAQPTNANDVTTKTYVDTAINNAKGPYDDTILLDLGNIQIADSFTVSYANLPSILTSAYIPAAVLVEDRTKYSAQNDVMVTWDSDHSALEISGVAAEAASTKIAIKFQRIGKKISYSSNAFGQPDTFSEMNVVMKFNYASLIEFSTGE